LRPTGLGRRHPGRAERRQPRGRLPLAQASRHRVRHVGAVHVELEQPAQGGALGILGRRHADPSVGGLVEPLERAESILHRVESAGAQDLAGLPDAPDDVRQMEHRRVQLRILDVQPLGVVASVQQAHHDARGTEQAVAGVFVAGRGKGLVALPGGFERDTDEAGHHRCEALAQHVRTA
jgi:hypothetical protein